MTAKRPRSSPRIGGCAPSIPALLTIIAPRHPARGESNRRHRQGRRTYRWACARAAKLPKQDIDVYIADTLGELGLIYRLAPIVFMGGSLVEHGGQNPIEAIRLGAAVVHGPHVWNFAEIYATLDEADGAKLVADEEALTVQLGAWLANPAARTAVAEAGAKTVRQTRRRARAHARRARSLSHATSLEQRAS